MYNIFFPFVPGATDLLKVANIETKISGTQDGMCPGRDVAYPLTGSEELNFQLQDAFPGITQHDCWY